MRNWKAWAILVLALTSRSRLPLVIYLTFSVIAYWAFFTVGGGDWMPMQRFAVHVLPFIYLIVQVGLERVDQRRFRAKRRSVIWVKRIR